MAPTPRPHLASPLYLPGPSHHQRAQARRTPPLPPPLDASSGSGYRTCAQRSTQRMCWLRLGRSPPAAKWGHSPKSWGNGGNIPLFPGLGECVGMGGMPILPLKLRHLPLKTCHLPLKTGLIPLFPFWAAARKSGQNVHTNCMGKASRGAA